MATEARIYDELFSVVWFLKLNEKYSLIVSVSYKALVCRGALGPYRRQVINVLDPQTHESLGEFMAHNLGELVFSVVKMGVLNLPSRRGTRTFASWLSSVDIVVGSEVG